MNTISTWHDLDGDIFHREVLASQQPALLKGLVKDWPAVKAATNSPTQLANYLMQFASNQPLDVLLGGPEIKGRFHYNQSFDGFNFVRKQQPLAMVLKALIELQYQAVSPAIAMQGIDINQYLPGFDKNNQIGWVDPTATARIWLGNNTITNTHYDTMENIACAVAGSRRITLFPPEQIDNLYIGPLLLTPAGTPMSLVDCQNPDFERFPKFATALEQAITVELEPGDALYIPSFWWHNVASLDKVSMLVNYWWKDHAEQNVTPYQSMLHSLLTIPQLPKHKRAIWQKLFEHYVFRVNADPKEHLPETLEDIVTALPEERKRNLMQLLAKELKA